MYNKEELDNYVQSIADQMNLGVEFESTLEEGEGKHYYKVQFVGDDLGFMIGPRGRHLKSLQYIVSLLIGKTFKKEERPIFVTVDAGGYYSDKSKEIENLAKSRAEDARLLGDPVNMEPMNAFDRRTVHAVLSEFSDIKTESQGEDPERYVRITPL